MPTIGFRVSHDEVDFIEHVARLRGITKSQIFREYLDKLKLEVDNTTDADPTDWKIRVANLFNLSLYRVQHALNTARTANEFFMLIKAKSTSPYKISVLTDELEYIIHVAQGDTSVMATEDKTTPMVTAIISLFNQLDAQLLNAVGEEEDGEA